LLKSYIYNIYIYIYIYILQLLLDIASIILKYYDFFLQELHLQDNNIRKLPNEIVYLNKLIILNVSRNNLKQLPDGIGQLQQLNILDISHNKLLYNLPKSLGYAQQLTSLNIDGLNLSYPPQDILDGGTIVIIAFLANESGVDYSPENSVSEIDISRDINSDDMQTVYHNKSNDVQVL